MATDEKHRTCFHCTGYAPDNNQLKQVSAFFALYIEGGKVAPKVRMGNCPELKRSDLIIAPSKMLREWYERYAGLTLKNDEGIMYDSSSGNVMVVNLQDTLELAGI